MTTLQQRQGEDESCGGRKKSKEQRESFAKRDHKKDKTPFRKNENGFHAAPFRPRYGGRFFRSRFMKDEPYFWRPGFSFRYQRYHPMAGVRTYHRPFKGSAGFHSFTSQSARVNNSGMDCKGMSKDQKNSLQSSTSSTPAKGKEHLSFTVQSKQVSQDSQEQNIPGSVRRAAMRSRAIQQKRHEIEEVGVCTSTADRALYRRTRGRPVCKACSQWLLHTLYISGFTGHRAATLVAEAHKNLSYFQQFNILSLKLHCDEQVYKQDCDTFGLVVKMLIAKDPSLEHPIQASLRENLQEIGLRCATAMQQFIHEYDLVHP
uniref:Periphilin-1-like n=1 Tax=Paramormyrops kingsleyae TaxID=1676925 RepID=A0A3B3QTD1_9TELE